MKQRSLLMLLPFALIVTGCGGNLKKGNLFNAKFIKQNFASDPVAVGYEYKNPEKINLDLGEGVTVSKYMGGVSDVLNVSKDGVKGYFCTTTNTFAVPLSAGLTTIDSVKTGIAEEMPYRFKFYTGTKNVDGNDIRMVFDDYGNKLYEGPAGPLNGTGMRYVDRCEYNEKEYQLFTITVGATSVYAFYNVDRTLKEVLSQEEYFKRKETYLNAESLAKYGHKELRMKKDNYGDGERYTVFNTEKGKAVSSFVIPSDAAGQKTIGDHIVYQIYKLLPQRAKKFDFSIGDDKYNYETYSVNYLNGKVSTIKTNFLLDGFTESLDQKDKKGDVKYAFYEKIYEITKDKVVSSVKRDVIVDEKLHEVADVSSLDYTNLKLFDKEHLISTNNIIYDFELKETGTFEHAPGDPINVATVNGKKTIVDFAGKYLVEPIYTSITEVAEGKYYILETVEAYKFARLTDDGKAEVYGNILKSEYTPFAGVDYGSFTKFRSFTKISDSSKVMFDATTGEELAIPEHEGTTLNMMGSIYTNALVSSIKVQAQVYLKDGAYYMVRYYQKTNFDFPTFDK